jgi:PEGA domain
MFRPWRGLLVIALAVAFCTSAAAKRSKPHRKAKAGKPAPDTKKAGAAFKEGQRLFDQADYLGAIESFDRAYKLRPHHVVMCNIALCHERTGGMVAAAKAYQRCIDDGAAKSPRAEAVRNSLKKVQARISWIEVKSEGQGGTVYIDGKAVGTPPQRVPVNPGTRVVEVRQERAKTASETIQTRGGEERQLTLTPVIVEQEGLRPGSVAAKRGLPSYWFWGAAGLTVAFAVVATILGVQTLGLRDDYKSAPSQDLLDSGKSRRTLTNVFWGLTGAAAAGTGSLFFFTDFGGGVKERSRADTRLVLGLRGTF